MPREKLREREPTTEERSTIAVQNIDWKAAMRRYHARLAPKLDRIRMAQRESMGRAYFGPNVNVLD